MSQLNDFISVSGLKETPTVFEREENLSELLQNIPLKERESYLKTLKPVQRMNHLKNLLKEKRKEIADLESRLCISEAENIELTHEAEELRTENLYLKKKLKQ